MLHTHLLGKINIIKDVHACVKYMIINFNLFKGIGLEVSVVDETTCSSSGQSRVEQTQIIDKNLNYDFNFQQANHLRKEIIVKPVRCFFLSLFTLHSKLSLTRTTISFSL